MNQQQQQEQQEQSSLHDTTDFMGDLSNEDEGLTFSLPPAISSTPSPTSEGQVCCCIRLLCNKVTVLYKVTFCYINQNNI